MKPLPLTFLFLVLATSVFSQSTTVVFSQNKCHYNKIDSLNQFWKGNVAPLLNGMVKDNKLIDWGVLEHAWGDEWNWNVYYVAQNQIAFHEAFNEFFEIINDNPEFSKFFGSYCFEHKDSMYSQTMGYTDSQ